MLFGHVTLYMVGTDEDGYEVLSTKRAAALATLDLEIKHHQTHFTEWLALQGRSGSIPDKIDYLQSLGESAEYRLTSLRIPSKYIASCVAGYINLGHLTKSDEGGFALDVALEGLGVPPEAEAGCPGCKRK